MSLRLRCHFRLFAVWSSWLATLPAFAAPLAELPVLSSQNGVLDLLVVARPEPITTFESYQPEGWVYDICPRPFDGSDECPAKPPGTNLYGGTRLQLQPGDTLKMRLVNKLPLVTDSEHARERGFHYLGSNPTNLHTHGMLVSPHWPTRKSPTYGDNIFVMTLNPDNPPPDGEDILHGDVRLGFTNYEIKIPKSHPSGLFWLHAHLHGLTLNQLNSGLSGVITIGQPSDYLCKDADCGAFLQTLPVRHLLLKDAQVIKSAPGPAAGRQAPQGGQENSGAARHSLETNRILTQAVPVFCKAEPVKDEDKRQGSCLGMHGEPSGGGRWFFSVNGQVYPHIPVASGNGEIWRITTGSATVTYDLGLRDDLSGQDMLVQVLAVDGVAVEPDANATMGELRTMSGTRIQAVPCPADVPGKLTHKPLCASRIRLMPSSRVELWVAHRDVSGRLAPAGDNAGATLYTAHVKTGPAGDHWPDIDLARVSFRGTAGANAPQVLSVTGDANAAMRDPRRLSSELKAGNALFASEPDCQPLAPGHKRRIFMGFLPGGVIEFGLGYEELDENGEPVPGTFLSIAPFNPDRATVCVPLGPGNTPAVERWQIVNIASEDHNFHVHQTKFSLLSRDVVGGRIVEHRGGVLHDNVPVPHADGLCRSVDEWRAGACVTHAVELEIPFTVTGDFAYHCHIGEHVDDGMMARIRVRANKP